MTFEKYWPTACLPGEYDSMDACDQGRWRGVAQAAYQAGRDAMREEVIKAIQGGSFLHDKSPAKMFANEVCKMLGELK